MYRRRLRHYECCISAIVFSLLSVLPATANSVKCPEVLPDKGQFGTYFSCSGLVNKRGDDDISGGVQPSKPKTVWSDEHSSLLLVYDLPIFASRFPTSLIRRVGIWNSWLRRMEPQWRDRNGGITQVSYKGSKDAYNLFREAEAEGGEIAEFGHELLNFLRERWLKFQRFFPKAAEAAETLSAQTAMKEGYSDDVCKLQQSPGRSVCDQPEIVNFYSWCNVFHRTGPMADEAFVGSWYGHQWDWHGYMILNGTGTQTGFISPFQKKVFVLRHLNNHIIMLPGGIKHAALHPGDKVDPRITMAFDIRIGADLLPYGIDLLAGMNITDRGSPDHTSLHRWQHDVMYKELASFRMATDVSWGGAVEYAPLVGEQLRAHSEEL